MHGRPHQPQRGATIQGDAGNQKATKVVELRNLPPTDVNFMPCNDRTDTKLKLKNRALMFWLLC